MKSAAITFLCLALAGSLSAQLQLTPTPSTYELDGVTFSQLSFTDGNKQVTYQPPTSWETSGTANKFILRPKGKTQAEATVTKVPLPAPFSFDEAGAQSLVKEALASIPSESTDIKVLSQEHSPVAIESKETFLVTMSYAVYGQTYGRSMMFLNRGNEQVRFQLTSRLEDFKGLQSAFIQSHFSWQNL